MSRIVHKYQSTVSSPDQRGRVGDTLSEVSPDGIGSRLLMHGLLARDVLNSPGFDSTTSKMKKDSSRLLLPDGDDNR